MSQNASPRPKNQYPLYRLVDAALRNVLRLLPPTEQMEQIALWWGYRYKPAPRVARLRSGALIRITALDYLQLLIYYLGTFEPRSLPYLKACAGAGGTIVDIGANIGFYTLESAVAVGPAGRVIAIEAAPPHAAALRENIRLNSMTNVSVIEAAASDTTGEAMLALPKGGNLGMYSLGVDGDTSAYRVKLRPLDDMLAEQQVRSVDLVKIDVEGSEHRALLGATATLAASRPAILIELNESALQRCASSTRQVKELLGGAGYRGWVIGRTGMQPILDSHSTHACDECLFLHRSREPLIRQLRLSERAG